MTALYGVEPEYTWSQGHCPPYTKFTHTHTQTSPNLVFLLRSLTLSYEYSIPTTLFFLETGFTDSF